MDGRKVKEFEKMTVNYLVKISLMVNSGSSTNLLALASLNLKKDQKS